MAEVSFPVLTSHRSKCKRKENSASQGMGGQVRVQGWQSGESTCLLTMWPGIGSWTRGHIWVEFVVNLVLFSATRAFSLGNLRFASFHKNQYI